MDYILYLNHYGITIDVFLEQITNRSRMKNILLHNDRFNDVTRILLCYLKMT